MYFRNTADNLLMKINTKADKEELSALKKILINFDAKLNNLSVTPDTAVSSSRVTILGLKAPGSGVYKLAGMCH